MRRIGYGVSAALFALVSAANAGASAQSMAGAIQASDPPAYGGSVAVVDGDVLIGEPGNMIGPGAVYVYRKGSGGWDEVTRLHASDGYRGDGFGTAMASDGRTLLVSARPQPQVEGSISVYVFRRSPAGSWSEVGRLPAPDLPDEVGYGSALALHAGTALVGAPALAAGEGRGGAGTRTVGPGAVYVFGGSDGTWSERGRLTAGDADGGFGASLAAGAGRLLVGAPRSGGGST